MRIILNNREEEFGAEKLSVSQLLELKQFTFKMIVVKLNGKLIKKPEYTSTFISDGDNVNVLHLISGG